MNLNPRSIGTINRFTVRGAPQCPYRSGAAQLESRLDIASSGVAFPKTSPATPVSFS